MMLFVVAWAAVWTGILHMMLNYKNGEHDQ